MSARDPLQVLIEQWRELAAEFALADTFTALSKAWALNKCADELAALRAVPVQPQQEQDDLSRSPSLDCTSATGSPRSSQPEGSRR